MRRSMLGLLPNGRRQSELFVEELPAPISCCMRYECWPRFALAGEQCPDISTTTGTGWSGILFAWIFSFV